MLVVGCWNAAFSLAIGVVLLSCTFVLYFCIVLIFVLCEFFYGVFHSCRYLHTLLLSDDPLCAAIRGMLLPTPTPTLTATPTTRTLIQTTKILTKTEAKPKPENETDAQTLNVTSVSIGKTQSLTKTGSGTGCRPSSKI